MLHAHEALEGSMLVLFSASWYWSIARMLRERVVVGKNATFVAFICMGYVAGMSAKLPAFATTGVLSPLVHLYAWNLMVTLTDLALVLRFRVPRGVV